MDHSDYIESNGYVMDYLNHDDFQILIEKEANEEPRLI
jgi:hypothetical protein